MEDAEKEEALGKYSIAFLHVFLHVFARLTELIMCKRTTHTVHNTMQKKWKKRSQGRGYEEKKGKNEDDEAQGYRKAVGTPPRSYY